MNAPQSFSVGILSMPGEHLDTLELVDSLLAISDPDVAVYVHVNGGPSEPLVPFFTDHASTHLSGTGKNLGVAGGRNHLMTQEGFLDADLVLFLDNDLQVSRDLFDTYREAFAELEARGPVGIVGVPYYNCVQVSDQIPDAFEFVNGPLGTQASFVDAGQVIEHARHPGAFDAPLRPSNAGAVVDFDYAYLSPTPFFESIAASLRLPGVEDPVRYNQQRFDLQGLMKSQRFVPASNLPGGSTCMRSSVIAEVGMFDDLYSPYGAEDIDHAIRVINSGRANWVDLHGCLPHGKHERHARRSTRGGRMIEAVNRHRVRRLLCEAHTATDPEQTFAEVGIAELLAGSDQDGLDLNTGLFCLLEGFRIANGQLNAGTGPDWNTTLTLDLADLSPGRFGRDDYPSDAERSLGLLRLLHSAIRHVPSDSVVGVDGPAFIEALRIDVAAAAVSLLANVDGVRTQVSTLMISGRGDLADALTSTQRRELRWGRRRSTKVTVAAVDGAARLVRRNPVTASILRRALSR